MTRARERERFWLLVRLTGHMFSSGSSSALGLPLNFRIYYTFSLAAGG